MGAHLGVLVGALWLGDFCIMFSNKACCFGGARTTQLCGSLYINRPHLHTVYGGSGMGLIS
jgi:hypothetical protein